MTKGQNGGGTTAASTQAAGAKPLRIGIGPSAYQMAPSSGAKCDLSAGLSTGVSDVECSYNMAAIVEAGIFQPMEVPSITLGGGGSVCDKEASKGFETDAIQIPPPHPFTLGVVHEVYSGKEMSMQIAPAPARK